jgi:hypothetical protein
VPRPDGAGGDPGGLVVLAVSRDQATVLAKAGAGGGLSLALLRP